MILYIPVPKKISFSSSLITLLMDVQLQRNLNKMFYNIQQHLKNFGYPLYFWLKIIHDLANFGFLMWYFTIPESMSQILYGIFTEFTLREVDNQIGLLQLDKYFSYHWPSVLSRCRCISLCLRHWSIILTNVAWKFFSPKGMTVLKTPLWRHKYWYRLGRFK